MVADKGKKAKLSEKGEDDNSEVIDEKLVISIEKLQEIQDELEKINEEASDKVLEVEQKYNEVRKPVYDKRNEIIKSIPDFWLTAFLSHPALCELLTEEDQKIFKHLTSLEVEDFKDVKSGYSITFNFNTNPYFEETKLTKTFTFLDEGTRKVNATSIKWKEGMGIPNGFNHEKKGNKRPQVEESFFSWFSDTEQKDIDDFHDEVAEIIKEDQQLSDQWKLMRIGEDPSEDLWMADNLPADAAVGVDPWCVSVDTAQKWIHAFSKKQQKLVQTSTNLVDEVWKNRPPPEINPVIIHPLEYAGRSVEDKLKTLRAKLSQEKAHGLIVVGLDEVAWLYNIRGSDVSYCPVVHAFAIVTLISAFFYVEKRKVSDEVRLYMEKNGIEVRDYSAVITDVSSLASNQLNMSSSSIDIAGSNGTKVESQSSGLIWADPAQCCYALYSKLNSDKVLLQQSPLALAKALKNSVELDGLKNAHIRDGAAVVQYLVWLDKQLQETYGASGYFLEGDGVRKPKPSDSEKLTEVSVSDKLEAFRASKKHFRGLSFPTISSVGPNAAIIHYGPQAETCAELDPESMYLFDSGAQYLDGTTDITRTVHFGLPSAHEKACYTAVLKGHIALGNARFPNGTNGQQLDILARVPLWKDGLDYLHGTGHGIGSFLNVHEGPHLISFRPRARNVPLQASMTVTDEPGYYEDGAFGIRLENVLIVKDADTKFNFGDKGYLSFEHITWAPYQRKLINTSLLTSEELDWLNSYHSKCRDILAPYLDESEKAWVNKATEPIPA